MTPALKFDPAAWQPDIEMVRYSLANGLTLLVLPAFYKWFRPPVEQDAGT